MSNIRPGSRIAKQVIKELKAHGWWAAQVSANLNPGIPDVLATRPGGSLHIELKALGDALRDSQINWALEYCKQTGGAVWVLSENREGHFLVWNLAEKKPLITWHCCNIKEAVECILTSTK